MSQILNPLKALDNIKDTYRNYVGSFQEFKNPAIKRWVEESIKDENLLYKGPFIQLNRRFEKGEPFEALISKGLLHPETPSCFTTIPGDSSAHAVSLHKHQSEAIKLITAGKNTIISTGTGSGKSFCFGIPVVSTCLKMQEEGIQGIKAIFVYPMNALANSQYDDFAKRLHGSGLKIAIYTGDTARTKVQGIQDYMMRYGREPYDSELLSREEIQQTPPDILITNYVMLEYILTRFEDRKLFPIGNEGVLKYLVLDEVHTYTGKKGADVAYLIRRLKQSTATKNRLRCIGTSATVQDTDGTSSSAAITRFASELFGEPFGPDAVVGESYIKLPHDPDAILPPDILVTQEMISEFEDTEKNISELVKALTGIPLPSATMDRSSLGAYLGKQKTIQFLENNLIENIREYSELVNMYRRDIRPRNTYEQCSLEITGALLAGMHTRVEIDGTLQARIIPKIHTFFSQGRDIKSCITSKAPHLNDAGEVTCPHCAKERKEHKTFPLVFCRSCGQEYYSVEILNDGTLIPHELGDEDTTDGRSVYLYPGEIAVNIEDLPEGWITDKTREVRSKFKDSVAYEQAKYCPTCNKVYRGSNTGYPECICPEKVKVTIIPSPFMYCPSKDCGVHYDKRVSKEFNKLFSFTTVGRSTATDVLVSSTLNNLPDDEKKIIAFTDNRQDTALQAAHINNIQKRMHFRRAMYHAIKDQKEPIPITELRDIIYETMEKNKVLPEFAEPDPYGANLRADINAYKDYLLFNALLELGSTRQKTQPNLEDMGLLRVNYMGMDKIAADTKLWEDRPELMKLSNGEREDYLAGLMDIMRYNLAIDYSHFLSYQDFYEKVINKLQPIVLFHNENVNQNPTGYSNDANSDRREANILRFASPNGNLVRWTKKALNISDGTIAMEIVNHVATQMQNIRRLSPQKIYGVGTIWMMSHDKIEVSVPDSSTCSVCKKCGKVHYFNVLNCCTGPSCTDMMQKDMSGKYFRREYTKDFSESIYVNAEEHSGQIDGDTRKDLEVRFRDKGDVNVIVCTPTMELGIDIGSLSAVYMRNVPPSPSNYAQRAGRAGRKSQSSMISTFCGVGMKRGPHDQYFYRYPKDIISGKISVPRFMLNNQILVRSHIHSLIIESLSLKIPQKLSQVIDLEKMPALPMFSDIDRTVSEELIDRNEVTGLVADNRRNIVDNIKQAMSMEMAAFDWFDDKYIEEIVDSFITDLDNAFNPFRKELIDLTEEVRGLDILIRNPKTAPKKMQTFKTRRDSIETKMAKMQSGNNEYATYSYLAEQGFIPNYGFPTLTTTLSLIQRTGKAREEKDLLRDQSRALREYAPGNSIYYRGDRYVVNEARIKTLNNKIETSNLLLCPRCGVAYLDDAIVSSGGCCQYCSTDLSAEPMFNHAVQMLNQRALKKNGITSDEEERHRLGYDITSHYRMSGKVSYCHATTGTGTLMRIGYDHDGKILEVNKGAFSSNGDTSSVNGFILCTACNRWITSKKQLKEHTDESSNTRCWRSAKQEDIVENIVLYTEARHDVVSIDCEPPADLSEEDYSSFYISLSEAIMQSLQITMNIDVDELQSFLMPHPEIEKRSVIIIYEMAEGGAGILKGLTETDTFQAIMKEARKILHEGEPSDKTCQKACYLCLCNYYNQRVHDKLDRNLVLPVLRELSGARVDASVPVTIGADYDALLLKCESSLEEKVLEAIRDMGIRLPDEAQYLVQNDGDIIAKPDFAYTKNGLAVVVFVDGPKHDDDAVKHSDEEKRRVLDLMGWKVFAIRFDEDVGERVLELGKMVGRM